MMYEHTDINTYTLSRHKNVLYINIKKKGISVRLSHTLSSRLTRTCKSTAFIQTSRTPQVTIQKMDKRGLSTEKDTLIFLFVTFIYLKGKVTVIFNLLGHFPKDCSSQGGVGDTAQWISWWCYELPRWSGHAHASRHSQQGANCVKPEPSWK